jgi:hypothetical protein
MTLASILLVSIFCASSAPPMAGHQTAPQAAPTTKPAETAATQGQGTGAPAQNPPTPSQGPPSAATRAKASAGQSSAGQTRPTTAKRPRHKKRVLPPNCDNAPATAGQTASSSTPAAGDPAATGTAPAPATSSHSANCPPSKVIVRHGGTSEPSIQLAGGTGGDQTSHQRDTANQMLESTEANLKKIAGRQLTPNQQDMVNQIRQFIDQSKTAAGAGDLERARTLAWKAQLLSEELVKPEKQ